MLKTSETYRVSIALNDEKTTSFTLLSKPDATTLAAVAAAEKAPAELIEAAAFARDLVIPALGEKPADTPITAGGTQIGLVHIKTASAYVWQARKTRKPKPAEQTPPTPPAEQTSPAQKRGRKKNSETAEPVTE